MSGSTQCAMHPPAAGPRLYGKCVEKLRSVCRAATITIPPSLYSRNKEEGALEAALEELLAKHGLDADSGASAAAVLCCVAAIGPLLSCGRCSVCLADGRDGCGMHSELAITWSSCRCTPPHSTCCTHPSPSVHAGERAIAQVKSKLTIQRDLDGIDTSNIIEGGRRRRGAATVSYKVWHAGSSGSAVLPLLLYHGLRQ